MLKRMIIPARSGFPGSGLRSLRLPGLGGTNVLIATLLLCTLLLSSCGSARKTIRVNKDREAVSARGKKDPLKKKKERATAARVEHLLDFAHRYIGTPYRYGGDNPREGFDCSGFTHFVFNEYGVQLPRVSADMAREGHYVGKNELQKGDLIFFATGSTRRINHVGIIVETRPKVLMIHSSSSKGIRVDDIDSDYYRRRYVTSRRVPI